MTWGKVIGTIAAGAVVATATCNLALAQQPEIVPAGRVYVFHSKATGQCPVLDWHVVAGPNNTLGGMVAWDDMKAMATVTGSITPDRNFKMLGTEQAPPHRQATITGTLRTDGWLVANIKGANIDCQGITVPWFVPPPMSGG